MIRLLAVILMILPLTAPAQQLWAGDRGAVKINQTLLANVFSGVEDRFTLPVDGRELQIQVEEISVPNLGVTSLLGRIDGKAESFLLLCRTETGATVAFFQPGDGSAWRLDHTPGFDALRAVDYEALGSCAVNEASRQLPRTSDNHRPPAQPLPDLDRSRSVADDGSRHDIVVGYTPRAEEVMGGFDFIRAEAQLAIDAANLAYDNSIIAADLRLVHTMSTDYDENTAWDYENHLEFLWYPDDGNMDNMLVNRDLVGADFVCVFIDGRDTMGDVPVCGIAPVMQSDEVNPDFEDLALSIVSVTCATENWSLAHEVGHNRGCAHNRQDATIDGAYSYSYGRRFVGADDGWYRTVMAYDHFQGGYTRIPYFTNPDVYYAGVPTGVTPTFDGEAHNALTHDNTAPVCAGFRDERTFVMFGWTEFSDGLILTPFATIAEAVAGSRDGGTIVIQNDNASYTGTIPGARTYVHDGPQSVVLGGF
jgi:hypothetical protein